MRLAICVIAYNRVDSIKRALTSIQNGIYDNDQVDLFISIDYSGENAVESLADSFDWQYGKKKVIAHKENLGLRKHILSCGELTYEYDGLIVLEDDVYVAQSFYLYAKACVSKYCYDDSIAGISLYSFHLNYHNWLPFEPLQSNSDVYLMQNAQSWGQVWMPRQWQMFKNWYEDNSEDFECLPHLPKSICSWKKSWLKYHTRYCIETNKYFIYPYMALSTCFSDTGEHTLSSSSLIQVQLCPADKHDFNLNPTVVYDAFFENTKIAEALGIESKDICIDIYGEKLNRTKCRYWLTREIKDYKIIQSFGLQLKPMETNIFHSIDGNVVFLYDTSIQKLNERKLNQLSFFEYLYNLKAGVRNTFINFQRSLARYLKFKL